MADSAAQAGSIIFSLLTGIVLANLLGAEGRGAYVFATSFAALLLLGFVNFGLELGASVLVAKRPRMAGEIHGIVLASAFAVLGLLAITLALAEEWIRAWMLPGISSQALMALGAALPFWVYQYGCYGILVGQGRVRSRALYELILSAIQNSAVILLLLLTSGLTLTDRVELLVFAYYGIVVAGSILLPAVHLRSESPAGFPRYRSIRRFFAFGFQVYIGNLGSNLSQRIDQYFVQQVSRDPEAFGVYTLATSLTSRTRIFPQALSRASYSRICSSPEKEAAELAAACFRQMLALGLILLALGALLSPLIPIIYSDAFSGAVIPFIIFLGGRLFHNCAWMLANYFSGHLARPGIATAVNWSLLPIQAVLAFFAMSIGGLVAVAMITSLTYFLLFIVFTILFLRWQDHVSAIDLFRFSWRDVRPWLQFLHRLRPARRSR